MIWLLLLACHRHDDEAPTPAPYDPPDLPGPYTVGTAADVIAGPAGVDLPSQLWYPARDEGAGLATYGALGSGVARADATPDCRAQHPVVLFSHMSGWYGIQSYTLAERLASHGYVVVAPDHVGNTHDDMDLTALADLILRRPLDLSESYDAVVARAGDRDDPLAGCLDRDAGYAVVGHDLGGTTALMLAGADLDLDALTTACEDGDSLPCDLVQTWQTAHPGSEAIRLGDDRVWAAVAIAPTALALQGAGLDQVTGPVALIGGSLDSSTSWDEVVAPLGDGLVATERGLGAVLGAGHGSFTDLCPVSPGWPECGAGYLSVDEAHDATNAILVPYLEVQRGESRAEAYLPPESESVHWELKKPDE